jgi:hypothetical protein
MQVIIIMSLIKSSVIKSRRVRRRRRRDETNVFKIGEHFDEVGVVIADYSNDGGEGVEVDIEVKIPR